MRKDIRRPCNTASSAGFPLSKDLFLLRPDIVFLNHGSFGATPRVVLEKYQELQRELEVQPVEFLSLQRRFTTLISEARASLAAFVGTAPDNIAFYPNATSALNVVIRSLEFQPGDEVLASNHEYGALDRAWRFIGRKAALEWIDRGPDGFSGTSNRPNQRSTSGNSLAAFTERSFRSDRNREIAEALATPVYRQQAIPLPVTMHEDFIEQFWRGVTCHTRVIYLSHITSPTALIFPVKEICRRARERNIISIIDGAHVIGQLPLDLEDLGADFYASNCHKWLCAPKGSAFLYVRPSVQHLVEPLIVSWGYEPEMPGKSRFIDEHEWLGTRDYSAFLSVSAAIKFQQDHDWDAIRKRCHELAREARREIIDLTGLLPICPDSPEWFMQMCAVRLPPVDPLQLKQRLYDEYMIEVPIYTWNDEHFVRVSIQAYNSANDIQLLIEALRKLLPEVSTQCRK